MSATARLLFHFATLEAIFSKNKQTVLFRQKEFVYALKLVNKAAWILDSNETHILMVLPTIHRDAFFFLLYFGNYFSQQPNKLVLVFLLLQKNAINPFSKAIFKAILYQ